MGHKSIYPLPLGPPTYPSPVSYVQAKNESFEGLQTREGLPRWRSGKEPACRCKRCRFNPWVGKIPWRRKWQPTPIILPGEFHRQRSLAGYSPWGLKESDTMEATDFAHTFPESLSQNLPPPPRSSKPLFLCLA